MKIKVMMLLLVLIGMPISNFANKICLPNF